MQRRSNYTCHFVSLADDGDIDMDTIRKLQLPDRQAEFTMNLQQYRALKENQFDNGEDLSFVKVILATIEKTPSLWDHSKVKVPRVEWEKLGIEIYLRTGLIYSVEQIRRLFHLSKKQLLEKVRASIIRNDTPSQMEEMLGKWELYSQLEFYKPVLKDFEEELRRKIKNNDGDVADFTFDVEDEINSDLEEEEDKIAADNNGVNETADFIIRNAAANGATFIPIPPKVLVPGLIDGLKMSRDDYKSLKAKDFVEINDIQFRKNIIAIIETHEDLWRQKGYAAPIERWEDVAIELYLRSSFRLRAKYIRELWNDTKKEFSSKIYAIGSAKDDQKRFAAMDRFRSWELYSQMLFYRTVTKEYEEKLVEKYGGVFPKEVCFKMGDPYPAILFIQQNNEKAINEPMEM